MYLKKDLIVYRLREKLSPEKFNLESLLKDEQLDVERVENELKQVIDSKIILIDYSQ